MAFAATALLVVGGALQVIGVALVAFGVKDVRQRVRAYVSRPVKAYPLTGHAKVTVNPARAVVSPPPPLEQRVSALEDGFHQLRTNLVDIERDATKKLRAEIVDTATTLTKRVRDEIDQLGSLILDLNDETAQRRTIAGVALLIAGLVLVTAGPLHSSCRHSSLVSRSYQLHQGA